MAALADPEVRENVAGLVLVDVVPDPDPERIFARLAQSIPAFRGLSYATLGELGAPIAGATADVAVG